MQHVNLIIATPGYTVMTSYLKSLLALITELNNREITWAFSAHYSSLIHNAREMTLSGTNQNSYAQRLPFEGQLSYDKIMWIDSDIAFEVEDVLKLYYSDHDIITGAYLLANGESPAYPKFLGRAYTVNEIQDMTELQEIEATGFGFLCVKGGVFENLTRPWFAPVIVKTKYEDDDTEYEIPIMGEDIAWSYRVRELGFKIWLDPSVKVTHHKSMQLAWDGIKP